MDNNKPTVPPPPPATPSQPAPVASPNTIPTVAQADPTGGGNKLIFIIIGLVAVILIAAGIYWYMSMKKTAAPVAQSPAITVPVISQNTSTIDADLGAIDIAPADSELDTIDQDLQNL